MFYLVLFINICTIPSIKGSSRTQRPLFFTFAINYALVYINLCTTTLCEHRQNAMLSRYRLRSKVREPRYNYLDKIAALGCKDSCSLTLFRRYMLLSTVRQPLFNHLRSSSRRQEPMFFTFVQQGSLLLQYNFT